MKNNRPAIICWRITSKCNRKCPFCFRPDAKDLKKAAIYRIIDKLVKNGIKGIGITGGEPLLRKDIAEILKYLKNKKVKICLATNTDFYHRHQKSINKYVTAIGIPIDGSKKEIHDSIRGIGNFDNVIDTANKIYSAGKLGMYFSTVITRKNINDLKNIECLLAKYQNRIIYWKIYELIDYCNRSFQSMKNCDAVALKINNEVKKLGKKLGKDKIFFLSSKKRSGASFLINPDGSAIAPLESRGKTKDIFLGNLLSDNFDKILKKWNNVIDYNYNKYDCHKCALKCQQKN